MPRVMNPNRCLARVPAFSSSALAQAWPSKPVHFILPFAPAGPVDIIARLVLPKVSEILGQQLLIENKPGAGRNVGAALVAKSLPMATPR
jgi:tripartite-type tricarboxylate transporter receptor subunit TctC